MSLVSDLAATLQTLLTTEAEDAPRATGWLRRGRQFRGATLVQTLVLGWLHDPHAPVDGLVEPAVPADRGPRTAFRSTLSTGAAAAELFHSRPGRLDTRVIERGQWTAEPSDPPLRGRPRKASRVAEESAKAPKALKAAKGKGRMGA